MTTKPNNELKIDPSAIKQHFTAIEIKIHCCRYWKLSEWEFNNLAFPFWRLYYNTVEGAKIFFDQKEVLLNENIVVLIPPYTSFSTSLKQSNIENLTGSRIQSTDEYRQLKQLGMVDHLFIHFNLGFQYDQVKPDIYTFPVTSELKPLLNDIRLTTIESYSNFSFRQTMNLHQLIAQLVNIIPETNRNNRKIHNRIIKVIDYIDQYYIENITNDALGKVATMATNSLLRLFKSSTGVTLQQFIQNKRIEKAIIQMHEQRASIDQIAERTGFSDRQHFSKVFKRITGTTPAAYRKLQTL